MYGTTLVERHMSAIALFVEVTPHIGSLLTAFQIQIFVPARYSVTF